jgi:hypothetical protein
VPMNQQMLLQKFKETHLQANMKINGQDALMPKPDKILEWELFNIMEALWAINGHLARIASHSGMEIADAK